MSRDELTSTILKVLGEVAPEVDLGAINPDSNFRDQFDFDSVDFLNFVLALGKALKVEIPELDYPKLANLNGCLAYLGPKVGTPAAPESPPSA